MKPESNNFKELARKYPVVIYYIITFLISWGGLVILSGGFGNITSKPTKAPFLPLYFITVAGPSIAGILLTGLYGGKKGYRDLISRLIKWRVSTRWYLAALLIAPFTLFIALLTLSLISPVYLPAIVSSAENPIAPMFDLPGNNTMILLLFILMLGLFNGFVEELGWTGFAAHRLRQHHSFIAAGLNIGFMWGLWHLLSNYIGSATGAGTVPLSLYIPVLLFSFLPPFRILMIWVYKNTESLFILILMHASLDVFWILSMPHSISGQERLTWYVVWAAVLWGITAAAGIVSKKRELHNKKESANLIERAFRR